MKAQTINPSAKAPKYCKTSRNYHQQHQLNRFSMSMELRKVTDALLRSQASSPFTTFLAPSLARWHPTRQLSYKQPSHLLSKRTFTSSSHRSALEPSSSASAPPVTTTEETEPSTEPSREARPAPAETRRTMDEISKSLNWATPSSKPQPILTRNHERALNNGSTADELIAALKEASTKSREFNIQTMAPLRGTNVNSSSLNNDVKDLMENDKMHPRIPLKLNPTTGRTFHVVGNVDLGRALRLMEQACSRNRIRGTANKQRFHERGGLKKKRLRRERWRIRFMDGFRATVGRVKQLRNQGW